MALAKGRNTSFLDRLYKNTVHIQGTILASFSLTFAVFSPGILKAYRADMAFYSEGTSADTPSSSLYYSY